MSEEILNEIEGTQTETENSNETEIIEIPQRANPFCVISKSVYGEYAVHDIQTNSAWSENPYKDYAIVPDEMVTAIQETRGFCDITLNEDGTEIVGFTAREIPDIPEPTPEPTAEERLKALEEENALLMQCIMEMSEIIYA